MSRERVLNLAVVVAALGYFVDVYDLILFSVVRVASLQSLGLSGDELLSQGVCLLNMQMLGMLLGGIIWGIWGDKRGRVSVLFGSIFLYSIANILNGSVQSVESYAWMRFLAGIGLAGELGAGITLVAETLPREKRGYGTTIVASVGVFGAVVASLVGDLVHWRNAYCIGGAMGILLLGLRVFAHESGMFKSAIGADVKRGDLRLLFSNVERVVRYVSCILIGVPIWYVIGILMTFAPEMGRELAIAPLPTAGKAILYSYIGLVLGDVMSGLLSQRLRSRRRAIMIFLGISALASFAHSRLHGITLSQYYLFCVVIGFGAGYWAVFITTAAEQFGTNLRATVATTVPNFVRGSVVPVTTLFQYLKPSQGILGSALVTGAFVFLIALCAALRLKESFHKDLQFVES